jgi:hypothetical protein
MFPNRTRWQRVVVLLALGVGLRDPASAAIPPTAPSTDSFLYTGTSDLEAAKRFGEFLRQHRIRVEQVKDDAVIVAGSTPDTLPIVYLPHVGIPGTFDRLMIVANFQVAPDWQYNPDVTVSINEVNGAFNFGSCCSGIRTDSSNIPLRSFGKSPISRSAWMDPTFFYFL